MTALMLLKVTRDYLLGQQSHASHVEWWERVSRVLPGRELDRIAREASRTMGEDIFDLAIRYLSGEVPEDEARKRLDGAIGLLTDEPS